MGKVSSEIRTVKRQLMLEEWEKQVVNCRSRGLTVQEWCRQNGVKDKTYYYRLRQVREKCLEARGEKAEKTSEQENIQAVVPLSMKSTYGEIRIYRLKPVVFTSRLENKLCSDDTLIDEYLAQAQLSDENRNIVSSWKKHIKGKFILERHLKKGSIFISMNDEKVYLVKGLNSTWREMLDGMPPPVLLNATLLPWKDVIISDGLVALTPVYFGKGYSTEFKEIYMNAKHNSTIFNSL